MSKKAMISMGCTNFLTCCMFLDLVTACRHGSPWLGFSCAGEIVSCRNRRRQWGRCGLGPCSDSVPQTSQARLQTEHGLAAVVRDYRYSRCLSQCWGSPVSQSAESFPGYSGWQIHASSYKARTIFNVWSFILWSLYVYSKPNYAIINFTTFHLKPRDK